MKRNMKVEYHISKKFVFFDKHGKNWKYNIRKIALK